MGDLQKSFADSQKSQEYSQKFLPSGMIFTSGPESVFINGSFSLVVSR